MTPEEARKIKVGDTVGLVVDHVEKDGDVLVKDVWGTNLVRPSAIVSHTPAPRPALKVGDQLSRSIGSLPRQVIWIEDGWVYFNPTDAGVPSRPLPLSEVETWERLS